MASPVDRQLLTETGSSQGLYNLSENGNIVTSESDYGTMNISYLDMWERICHKRKFGVLRNDFEGRVLSADMIARLPADALCLICLQKLRACTFRDCGHFLVCLDCQHLFTYCPVCRKEIKSYLHTLL